MKTRIYNLLIISLLFGLFFLSNSMIYARGQAKNPSSIVLKYRSDYASRVTKGLIYTSTLQIPSNTIIIENENFAAIENFYAPHIQAFLDNQGSGLAKYSVGINGKLYSAAEIIMNASFGQGFFVNPKILLTILEATNGLMTIRHWIRINWSLLWEKRTF